MNVHEDPNTPHSSSGVDVDIPARMLPCTLRALWAAMNDDARVGVKLLDEDGRVIAMNACACELLGQSLEVASGQKLVDIYPEVHRQVLERDIEAVKRAGEQGDDTDVVCETTYLLWGYRRLTTTRLLRVEDAHLLPESMPADTQGRRPTETLGILRVCKVASGAIEPAKVVQEVQATSDRQALLGKLDVLSDRELEVAMLIAAGMSDADIAKQLYRSLRTVHAHRRSIGAKLREELGLTTRSQMAQDFGERGLRASVSLEDTATDN